MDQATRLARRASLAAELNRLRVRAGLSTTELGRLAGFSQAKVSRMENGQVQAGPEDVRKWTQHTGAAPAEAGALIDEATELKLIARTWQQAFAAGMAARQADMARLEAECLTARILAGALIPGLLQVPAYASAIYGMLREVRPDEIGTAVAARMARQQALYRDGAAFTFIVGELALEYLPEAADDGAAWRQQVERLLLLADLPAVELLVLPNRPGWPLFPNAVINLYHLPDEHVGVIEDPEGGERILAAGAEFDAEVARFDALRDRCLSGRDAAERVTASLL